jgi:RNA polymerase sigma-70 factor (ECF subfamily)
MIDERQIVSRILKGDFHSFRILVSQFERLVFHVVGRLVENKEDQEDLCQEVFIKVHAGLSRFAFESRLSTWIAQIAYFTAVNHLKQAGRHSRMDPTEVPESFAFEGQDPGEILTRKDQMRYLAKLIAQLPEKYRVVFSLFHLEEFSLAEIAEIMAMPEGTVKSHLFRTRRLLKAEMEKQLKTGKI